MSFYDAPTLESTLTSLQLVDQITLDECRRELGPKRTPNAMLDALSRRNALTVYQVGRLKKGESDGLRLGPYKLLYRNASGSFARVYRAASVEDGHVVGIKLLRQRWASDVKVVTLFRREGELGKRLKHRNIVPIYDVVSEGKNHFLTMEFVEGGNLRDLMKIRGKFTPAEATRYIIDIAEGLQYALGQGFTHRDLKLTNVLLSSQGVAKLVDFGLAGNDQALSQFEEEVDRALEYAALEKGTGAPDNDPRSDLYFLGAIYYELLTGRPPYPSTRDRQERKRFGRYRDVRPIRSVDPNIPDSIETAVRHLMNVNLVERYQTPAQVLADLKPLLQDLKYSSGSSPRSTGGAVLNPDEDEDNSETSETESAAAPGAAAKNVTPTILCVEDRPKHQDSLRAYFTKHGYRVLLLTDPERALQRLTENPPDAVVFIGDSVGLPLPKIYESAVSKSRRSGTPVIVVLGKKEIPGAERLKDQPSSRVLKEGVTLRDIRHAVKELRQRNASSG